MPVSMFENKPECCPFGHQLWPGRAQVSWKPCLCEPAREAAGPARVMTPSAANAARRVSFAVNMIEPPRGDAPWERLQLITNGVDT